ESHFDAPRSCAVIEPTGPAGHVILHHLVWIDNIVCERCAAVVGCLDTFTHLVLGVWSKPVPRVCCVVEIAIVRCQSIRQEWIELVVVIVCRCKEEPYNPVWSHTTTLKGSLQLPIDISARVSAGAHEYHG